MVAAAARRAIMMLYRYMMRVDEVVEYSLWGGQLLGFSCTPWIMSVLYLLTK